MGDDWVRPPADWSDIPDWDLATSVQREAQCVDERHRFLCSLEGTPGMTADEFVTEFLAYKASMLRRDLGLQWASREWAALSALQRGALAAKHAGLPVRDDATRRSLVRRELMDDMGLTEKGRFVLLEGIA